MLATKLGLALGLPMPRAEEFASGNMSASSGRTILAGSDDNFVWASIAQIYGIPGIPEWADWFCGRTEKPSRDHSCGRHWM
jgi:hypothetical protein